jgi:hypothetical protein
MVRISARKKLPKILSYVSGAGGPPFNAAFGGIFIFKLIYIVKT